MKSFQKIVLYARQHRANPGIYETLERLTHYWQKRRGLSVFLESETASHFTALDLPVADFSLPDVSYDLLVVVGGDGSLLGAARLAVQKNIPIIGINRGRLGFLTSISPQDAEKKLDEVLGGSYEIEERFLLQAQVYDKNAKENPLYETLALNDIVLTQGDDPFMIEFDVYCMRSSVPKNKNIQIQKLENSLISHYRADGLIVATPTGSTAYALSAGGPIIHPTMDAIALVPMFPHTLSSRPIVLGTENAIQIHLCLQEESVAHLIADGQERIAVASEQWIEIKKFPQKLSLLQPFGYHYYETLRSKLNWESRNF
jgi:NAD+ kinase